MRPAPLMAPMTGADLRLWREGLGLTQARAALLLGVTSRTWQMWEAREGEELTSLLALACRAAEQILQAQLAEHRP